MVRRYLESFGIENKTRPQGLIPVVFLLIYGRSMVIMNLVEINALKEELVNSIAPSLNDLRNESKNNVQSICEAFTVTTDDEIECVKLVLNEICSSNPNIRGRVDVFDNLGIDINIADELNLGPVKGVTLLLFLDKDKDRFDHRDINRFYVAYPEFYTGIFEDRDEGKSNQFISGLLNVITSIKEKNANFGFIKAKSIGGICNDAIPDVVDKVEQEGLKCKAIEHVVSDNVEHVYFFIYETECKEMNKQIEALLDW